MYKYIKLVEFVKLDVPLHPKGSNQKVAQAGSCFILCGNEEILSNCLVKLTEV